MMEMVSMMIMIMAEPWPQNDDHDHDDDRNCSGGGGGGGAAVAVVAAAMVVTVPRITRLIKNCMESDKEAEVSLFWLHKRWNERISKYISSNPALKQ